MQVIENDFHPNPQITAQALTELSSVAMYAPNTFNNCVLMHLLTIATAKFNIHAMHIDNVDFLGFLTDRVFILSDNERFRTKKEYRVDYVSAEEPGIFLLATEETTETLITSTTAQTSVYFKIYTTEPQNSPDV